MLQVHVLPQLWPNAFANRDASTAAFVVLDSSVILLEVRRDGLSADSIASFVGTIASPSERQKTQTMGAYHPAIKTESPQADGLCCQEEAADRRCERRTECHRLPEPGPRARSPESPQRFRCDPAAARSLLVQGSYISCLCSPMLLVRHQHLAFDPHVYLFGCLTACSRGDQHWGGKLVEVESDLIPRNSSIIEHNVPILEKSLLFFSSVIFPNSISFCNPISAGFKIWIHVPLKFEFRIMPW